jgi:hypothetical protein
MALAINIDLLSDALPGEAQNLHQGIYRLGLFVDVNARFRISQFHCLTGGDITANLIFFIVKMSRKLWLSSRR